MKFNWINKGMNKVLNKRIGTGLPADTQMGIVHIRGNYFIEQQFYEQAEERIERSVR